MVLFYIPKKTLIGQVEAFGLKKFKPRERFSIDTETTGLDMWGPKMVTPTHLPAMMFMTTLCDEDGNRASMRWPVNPFTREVMYDKDLLGQLHALLGEEELAKIWFNHSFDAKHLRATGAKIKGPCYDGLIRQHVIRSDERNFKLKHLCEKYLQIGAEDEQDLQQSTIKGRAAGKKQGFRLAADVQADYWLADPKICRTYAELDAYRHMALFLAQEEFFTDNPNMNGVKEREEELKHALDEIETRGVRVDLKRIKEVVGFYEGFKDRVEATIVKGAGKDFNPASPKQMTKLFFGELGFKPLKYSRKKKSKMYVDCQHCKKNAELGCKICDFTGRNPKCDGEFLESIAVDWDDNDKPIIKNDFAYALLVRNACTNMLQAVNQYKFLCVEESPGVYVIHPNYRQAKVRTGRLSCEKPNLQSIASEDSGKRRTEIPYRPRECFIPRPGYVFYVPDYSQIEVWILALLANAKSLIRRLAAGGDAHQIVADIIWPNSYDKAIVKRAKLKAKKDLTPEESKHLKIASRLRKIIKCINFGIIYGEGNDKLAIDIGCTIDEVVEYRRQYEKEFPEVAKFMKDSIRMAKEHGYVTDPWGRIYYIDRGLEYRATNYRVQGAAAQVLKSGMIALRRKIRKSSTYKGKLFPLMQIHDELMIEVHKSIDNMDTMKMVCDCMAIDSKFLGCPIPFPIGMKIAEERWSDSREVKVA